MTIKLQLDRAEYDPIARTAEKFGCEPTDVLYAALDSYMSRLGNLDDYCGADCRKAFSEPEVMREHVLNTKIGKKTICQPGLIPLAARITMKVSRPSIRIKVRVQLSEGPYTAVTSNPVAPENLANCFNTLPGE
jgi:hypothetical protein|uniref:hypothetical protein n=1 Tax=Cephaloticoccus sp. TaxID=1985742 RepID=UPI00404B0184